MRSRVARCLASKAVVVFGAGLPLSMNENGKKPGRDGAASLAGGGPGLAAGGGAPPDLGCGAGVGSGPFSADAGATASAVHNVAARIVVALRTAMNFSSRTGSRPPQSPERASPADHGCQPPIK